jgi:hypothetical protein
MAEGTGGAAVSALLEGAGASRPSGSEKEMLLAQLDELEWELAQELSLVADFEFFERMSEFHARYAPGTPHGDYKLRKQRFTYQSGDVVTYDPFCHEEWADFERAVGQASGSSFWRRWAYLCENEGRQLYVVQDEEKVEGKFVPMLVIDPTRGLVSHYSSDDFRPFAEEGFKRPTT